MKKLKVEHHGMEYNSEKIKLLYPEYGRNIQAMIEGAKDEPNVEKRQLLVEAIVSLMYQMNPQSKNVDDYKEKLWKHVFHIAGYNLGGVLPPSGIHPTPDDVIKRPEPIGYPASGARYRHYGNNVHQLIAKALSMEEGAKKEGMINTIGAYMKLAYRTWNKEHYVSDDIIKSDLETLSNGRLTLDDDMSIDKLATANKRRTKEEKTTSTNRSNNGGSNNNSSNNNQNRNNNNQNNRNNINNRNNNNQNNNRFGNNNNNNNNNRRK
jgi:hypothetical protein